MKLVSAGGIEPGTPHETFWYQPLKKRFPNLECFNYARGADSTPRRQLNAVYLERTTRARLEFLLEVVNRSILYPSTLAARAPN